MQGLHDVTLMTLGRFSVWYGTATKNKRQRVLGYLSYECAFARMRFLHELNPRIGALGEGQRGDVGANEINRCAGIRRLGKREVGVLDLPLPASLGSTNPRHPIRQGSPLPTNVEYRRSRYCDHSQSSPLVPQKPSPLSATDVIQ